MRRFLSYALLSACAGSLAAGATVSAQAVSIPQASAPAALTLDAAPRAALAEHPIVDSARARVTAAEGGRRTASTFPNPVATYWMENSRFPGQGPSTLDRETSVYATMPLEPLLQRSSRTAQAGAELRAAEADVATAERTIALQTAHAFYRVALAQATLDAVRDSQAAARQLVAYLRTRVSQGATPEGEAIRAEVEGDRADADVTLAEVELLL